MNVLTVLSARSPQGNRGARLWLWMIPMWVLQAAPASAQESRAGSQEQPSLGAEGAPQAPASTTLPEASAPAAKEEPSDSGSLEELLQEEVAPASVGSFGYRLRRYGITPYVHGVLSADLWQWQRRRGDRPHQSTFQLRDANLYFGADVLNLIVPEVFLEFEPGYGSYEFNTGIRLRYAQLDVRLHEELLVLRAGLFLIPFGSYNTTSYPAFITKLPERPTLVREVIPSPWQEMGVQLNGKWEWASGRSVSYALYATNGMEQFRDGIIDEGGSIAYFTPSYVDSNNNAKSFGARISTEVISGLNVGASGYTGAYTRDAARQLSLVGIDANFSRGPLSLELEAAFARQEISDGALEKWGYLLVAAYRVNSRFEPLFAIDQVRAGTLYTLFNPQGYNEDATSYWGGFIFYPFPDQIPTAVAKTVYRVTVPRENGTVSHRLILQLALGF